MRARNGRKAQGSAMAGPPLRQRILGAAFALFTRRGFQRTSTLEIATRARVSKRDLYALFAGKEAILAACIADRAARMREPLALPSPTDRAQLATLLTQFGGTVLRVATAPEVLAVHRLVLAESEASPELARLLEEVRQANRAALAEVLAAAEARGLIAPEPITNTVEEFFALLWGDLLLRLILRLEVPPDEPALARRAERAAAALLVLHPAPAKAKIPH